MATNLPQDNIMGTSTLDALLGALSVDVEAFALCEIAEDVRLVFARNFKATLGVTPIVFVARVRLNLARRLLASTVRSVDAIAADVGFSSRSHFSRVFRDQYGTDPATFRRRNFFAFSPDRPAS